MKVLPGGLVGPAEVVGRDQVIDRLWRRLETQGVVLVAERRMGKTSILRKMAAEPRPGFRLVYRDLEGCSGAADFASCVANDIAESLSRMQKASEKLRSFWSGIGGLEIGGLLKLPEAEGKRWSEVLEHSFGLLSEALATKPAERIVLAWDEFPLLLHKITQREGAIRAMDMLDALRAFRQTHPQIRLALTGSIGLHHVISDLREQDYPNSPKNDLYTFDLAPLEPPEATALAASLIAGEGLGQDPDDMCASTIAAEVDGFAFYIHHVIATMADEGHAVTPESARRIVANALQDSLDRWELRNYRERLQTYYQELSASAGLVLDLLAEQGPLTLSDLHDQVRLHAPERLGHLGQVWQQAGIDPLRKLLWRLQQDHYLLREDDGRYRFRFNLIRRWWLIDL